MAFTAITVFLFFFFTKGIRVILSGHAQKFFHILPFFIVAIVGYVFTFLRPKWGGLMLILAGVGLFLFHVFTLDLFYIVLLFGLPFIISGILLLAVATVSSRTVN